MEYLSMKQWQIISIETWDFWVINVIKKYGIYGSLLSVTQAVPVERHEQMHVSCGFMYFMNLYPKIRGFAWCFGLSKYLVWCFLVYDYSWSREIISFSANKLVGYFNARRLLSQHVTSKLLPDLTSGTTWHVVTREFVSSTC